MGANTNGGERGAARDSLDAIRRLVAALRHSASEAKALVGLPSAQLFVLQQLAAAAPLSINELAARTLTHQSSVSVVAQRLVERGLARKSRAPSDGRRVELSLTAAGRRVLRRAPAPLQHDLIEALRRLPQSRQRALATSLLALLRELGLGQTPAHMFFEERDPHD